MRPEGQFLATAVAALVLAGCGQAAEVEPVDLPSLRTKLHALTSDPCHSEPRERPPYACEKYVTQLANTARTVSAAGRVNQTALRDPGRRMTSAVRAFNRGGCDNERPKSDAACYTALETIAQAVADVEAELEETVQ
ncbi:MAG: hypothetical protein ACRDQB_04045 [Thermocrispum sp.]